MVVSSVTWPAWQLEPAAADDVAVHTAVRGKTQGNLARRHELHRGAQRVAQRQAQVGTQGAVRLTPPGGRRAAQA
jgi:hypothetical protein